MFDIEDFVDRCRSAAVRPDPVGVLRGLLADAIRRPGELAAAFGGDDAEETLVHACPLLTIVHVRLSPNVLFPPHNHHMEALIGAYDGGEVHRRYVRRGAGLVEIGEIALAEGSVGRCDVRDVHAVANPGTRRSAALHVYCGDLVHARRQIWMPDLEGSAPYSDERYFQWARPYDAARPFVRPQTCHAHQLQTVEGVTAPASRPGR
jgi:predicted metal-dependent enzyme (double-stranded beta helix superfamily)